MSGSGKESRRAKKGAGTGRGASVNRLQISTELLISLLVAGLYAVFLIETQLDRSMESLMFSAFLFVAFLAVAYVVRGGKHPLKREFGSLIYVFLGLSLLALAWQSLVSFGVLSEAKIGPITWIAVVGAASAIISAVIIAIIAAFEKMRPADLYLVVGDVKVLAFAASGFILCVLLGIAGGYVIFGGSALGQDQFITLTLSVLAFAVFSGVYEELWFRGLLLSRIVPILGESAGNIFQAAVFGVFEAVIVYTITGQVTLMPAMFIIGAMTGFYWGRSTQKSGSVLNAMLLHAGLYMLIMLIIMIQLLS